MGITSLGTQIRFDDGREATVVYNSLIIGVGIMWGLHDPDPQDFEGTDSNTFQEDRPAWFRWEPEALLREPFRGCERYGFSPDECVGEHGFEIIRDGLSKESAPAEGGKVGA